MKRIGLVALALMIAVAMSLGAVAAAPAPAAAGVPWGQAVVMGGSIDTTSDMSPVPFFQGTMEGELNVKATGCDGPFNVNVKIKIMDLTLGQTFVGTAAISGYVTTVGATQMGTLVLWGSIVMQSPGTVTDNTIPLIPPTDGGILTLKPNLEGYLVAAGGTLIWEFEEITPISGTASLLAKGMMLVNGILDNFVVNMNLGDAIHPLWIPAGLSSLGSTVVNGVAGMVGDAVDMLAGLVNLFAQPARAP